MKLINNLKDFKFDGVQIERKENRFLGHKKIWYDGYYHIIGLWYISIHWHL